MPLGGLGQQQAICHAGGRGEAVATGEAAHCCVGAAVVGVAVRTAVGAGVVGLRMRISAGTFPR